MKKNEKELHAEITKYENIVIVANREILEAKERRGSARTSIRRLNELLKDMKKRDIPKAELPPCFDEGFTELEYSAGLLKLFENKRFYRSRIDITAEELREYVKYHNAGTKVIKLRRLHAVSKAAEGMSIEEIAIYIGRSKLTIRDYISMFVGHYEYYRETLKMRKLAEGRK